MTAAVRYSGNLRSLVDQPVKSRDDSFSVGVFCRWQRQTCGKNARGIETRINVLQCERAANEQPGADEQDQRHGKFGGDEAGAQAITDRRPCPRLVHLP